MSAPGRPGASAAHARNAAKPAARGRREESVSQDIDEASAPKRPAAKP